MDTKCKNRKVYSGVFCATFFTFCAAFFAFCILQHFAPGLAFARKLKRFCGLFFCGINKTRNPHEMRKVYSKCFVFHRVFCEKQSRNAKCEKCIAGLTDTMGIGTRTLKLKYMTLNLGHILKYDSKTQTFFFLFFAPLPQKFHFYSILDPPDNWI